MTDFDPTKYQWKPRPEAALYVQARIDEALSANSWLRAFEGRLLNETGTRLLDWLDHIVVDSSADLEKAGFQRASDANEPEWYENQHGIFPKILVASELVERAPTLALKVECIEDFVNAHGDAILTSAIQGSPGASRRFATLKLQHGQDTGLTVRVVERHGYRGFTTDLQTNDLQATRQRALEQFRSRSRPYSDPASGFEAAMQIFSSLESEVDRNYLCDAFFQTEREYWQGRNTAAQTQFERQSALGMGWANHDHHTYRCSREHFAPLIAFLELAGFQCRERFYAGSDAGWGAQVLEQPECGIVIFADVDMSAEELAGDFAHDGLPPTRDHGTVGLWCQLHGDSFLAAGMHHLECQFDFSASQQQLAAVGIETMAPFTDFPHLKQAFTVGERWQLPEERLASLVDRGVISSDESARFSMDGVLGSHLEILERNDGFKGFNQTGISEIILRTNPKAAQ